MRVWRRNECRYSVCLLLLATLLAACGPTLDNSLSPPIIDKPIYDCAEVIAYSGADRDAKIIVYVNGNKVKEVNTWMGWGSITLTSTLGTGDVVSAAQVVSNRISQTTRDPVTVTSIPASLFVNEKLPTPVVVPPLYECQQVVRVSNVVQGATVTLNNSDGITRTGMTPYTVIRMGTDPLVAGQWYNAMQSMCKDKLLSDWGPKEPVQAKPSSLPEATIHGPLVAGTDACRVDNLIPGAQVDIYSQNSGSPTRVGGGIAVEAATIFHISPVVDANLTYYATQALCEVTSPPGKTVPTKDVPAPTPQTMCVGEKYVTVCDTVALSTVKVYVNGTQVAQAAGNGGCVTLALGDATALGAGNHVTATQSVAGNVSAASAVVNPQASGAPAYNPAAWNDPAYVLCNNCYNYGCDIRTDTFAQPGYAHGVDLSVNWKLINCVDVGNAAEADGLQHQAEKKCAGCTHLVALVIAPDYPDYHWYRLDDNGRWSHKPGGGPATDLDASDHPITNPETADRDYSGPDYPLNYYTFCTYYCVDNGVVVIDGSRPCNP